MSSSPRVLVVAAERAETVRRALSGLSLFPVTDPFGALGALRADDIEVVVCAPGIDEVHLLDVVRNTAPAARVVVIGPAVDPLPPSVSEYVAAEHVPTVLRAAVFRAARLRTLALTGDLHERTFGLATLTDPTELANSAVALARESAAADHAVYVARNREGTFHVVATSGSPTGTPPLPVLVRWTERLERERPAEPVAETRSDRHLGGVLVSNANHFHGVLWVSRSLVRRTFAPRELGAVGTVAQRALLAAEHDRLVKDLQHRLLSMEATRARLEEDARAASVGRLAVDALIAIRDPLAYTRTNLRAALESREIPPGSQAERHLEYALQGLERADRAVEDLSRVSQGRDRVPVEVKQLIESALSLVRPLAHPETVEISENAVVLGNPGRLAQALAEVLRNADQATGATRVDLSATRLKETVAIEIADDGEGIPAGLLSRVTEPFFSTRGRAGLGLTTARDVIERAGGTLEIRSRRGVGTVVRIQLPGERVDDEFEMAGEAEDDDEPVDLGNLLGDD
jgi:signal transduction histidine kinase